MLINPECTVSADCYSSALFSTIIIPRGKFELMTGIRG